MALMGDQQGDEDEGSLSQGEVNRIKVEAACLNSGKIERSADALQM